MAVVMEEYREGRCILKGGGLKLAALLVELLAQTLELRALERQAEGRGQHLLRVDLVVRHRIDSMSVPSV